VLAHPQRDTAIDTESVAREFYADNTTLAFKLYFSCMEIGSNYLCVLGSRPESVGSNIENLVSLLQHQCGAAFVIVCQVIHRKRLPAHCPHYNANVYLLNKYLRVVLEPLTYAEFWCHKGLR